MSAFIIIISFFFMEPAMLSATHPNFHRVGVVLHIDGKRFETELDETGQVFRIIYEKSQSGEKKRICER